MNFQQAQEQLNKCIRHELRDHAFGDTEVDWIFEGSIMASGYFNSSHASVTLFEMDRNQNFEGLEARELRNCGASAQVSRNDETGPIQYQEGLIMPGLTLEGVRDELTRGSE